MVIIGIYLTKFICFCKVPSEVLRGILDEGVGLKNTKSISSSSVYLWARKAFPAQFRHV